jgi:hypothetical protein
VLKQFGATYRFEEAESQKQIYVGHEAERMFGELRGELVGRIRD